MVGKTLLFYEKDDYYDYKNSKNLEGYSFESITKFIHNLSLIQEADSEYTIIDLSALTEYVNIQSVAEQIIYKFEENITYICDISKREKLEYELRLLFEKFQDIDKNSFLKTYRKIISGNEEQEISLKRHRKIIDLNDEDLVNFFLMFRDKLYGHSKFKDDFEEQIRTFRIFNKLGENKILSFFLMGESGVGKTEVARLIFKCLKGEKKFAKINFGNYSSEFSLSSLIGASRGYKDSDDGEIFMKVRDTDVGILLIDEFEKSNSSLFNYFLNVLETGVMESSLGQQIDLNGFIIIFTSNISKEDFKKRISPELRSRFDYKCMFTILGNEDKKKYIEFRAESIRKKVSSEFKIDLGDDLKTYLLNQISVNSFNNMRDINKRIKKEFLKYLVLFQVKENHLINEGNETNSGIMRRFLNFFNS